MNPVATQSPAQALKVVEDAAGYQRGALQAVPTLQYYFDPKDMRWRLAYTVENVPSRKSNNRRAPALFDYVVDAHTGALIATLPHPQGLDFKQTESTGQRRHSSPALSRARDTGCSEAAHDELGKERQVQCKLKEGRFILVDAPRGAGCSPSGQAPQMG
ncbi:hypothetical protein [Corallococcus macrosporus]|uniref:hypothetical protein n=1 Tax=Corallococcus macrosporus TaxID=35 RepID=UPI000F4F2C51|nr:hypothetical protein [Corallococcus macrosporus]